MTSKIEGIPAGYEMVAYREAKAGELCLMGTPLKVQTWIPNNHSLAPKPILKKIDTGRPMSEFPFCWYSEEGGTDNCLFYVEGEWVEGYGVPAKFMAFQYDEEVQPLGWKPKDE